MITYINVLLGFIISNLAYISTRNKKSPNSPEKFDIKFWWKDNRVKLAVSLVLALSVNTAIVINTEILPGFKTWHSILIGMAPDFFVNALREGLGWFKPKETEDSKGNIYKRK